ncbi:MAG: glycosyltransferase family 2 protein [Tidjanibacter sp.]|nr:glycosyltransferase family 2 protein [Tidjanibacter sp.]
MAKIQVVILNWNGADYLRRFLPAVRSSVAADVEVVVADNGSTDESREVANGIEGVEWLGLDRNYGFAEGYNRALEQLDGDLWVLLNSDVEPAAGWLEPLVERMTDEPRLGALQPKILSWHSRDKFEYAGAAGGFIDAFGYPFCRGRIMGTVENDEGQYDDACKLFWASGACMVVRADLFRRLGGFDGEFFAHMEEIDLCWRMQMLGYEVGIEPRSVVWHVGGGTLPNNSPRKIYLNFRNSLLMLYKCLPDGEMWRLRVRQMLDWLSWGVYLVTGRWSFAGAVWRAHRDFRRRRPRYRLKRECAQGLGGVRPSTIYRGWIIGRYVLGCKKFSKLDW